MNAVQLDLLNERQFQRLANNEVHHSGMVGAPYKSGSATSKAAAEKIAPKVGKGEGQVLDALAQYGFGLTDEEIDRHYGLQFGQTLRPRRVALSEWVYKVGKEVVRSKTQRVDLLPWLVRRPLVEQTLERRKTRSDNLAYVHTLTEAGRAVAEERARQ